MGAWIFPACGARTAGTCMQSTDIIAKDPECKRSRKHHTTIASSQALCSVCVVRAGMREKALPCCCDVPNWDKVL